MKRKKGLLTRMERVVLGRLLRNKKIREIADELVLSPDTIAGHVHNIRHKMRPNTMTLRRWIKANPALSARMSEPCPGCGALRIEVQHIEPCEKTWTGTL